MMGNDISQEELSEAHTQLGLGGEDRLSVTTDEGDEGIRGSKSERRYEEEKRHVTVFECKICLDEIVEPVVTKCGHLFCWPCIYQWLADDRHQECPCCKAINISISNLIPLYVDEMNGEMTAKMKYVSTDIPSRPKAHAVYAKPYTNRDEFDISAVDLSDMRRFCMTPIPIAAGTLQCYVKRVRHYRKQVEYLVYMKEGDRFLMYGRRQPFPSATYNITLDAPNMALASTGTTRGARRTSSSIRDTEARHEQGTLNSDTDVESLALTLAAEETGTTAMIGARRSSGSSTATSGSGTSSTTMPPLGDDGTARSHRGRTSGTPVSTRSSHGRKWCGDLLGRVQKNMLGTEFQSCDDGYDPADIRRRGIDALPRREYAAVMYEPNIFGRKGPRRMQVAIPSVNAETGEMEEWRSHARPQELINYLRLGNISAFKFLINKPPRWNDHVNAYVLNFNGRVTMASVKNFQLVDPRDPDNIILQFGRVDKDEFTMDFRWPMSPFQAFSIALSSFDPKLACE